LSPNKYKKYGTELGRGSYGTVFKGKIGTLKVAIKEVRLSHAGIQEAVEKEIKIMHGLNHPNLVRCFGCVST
jgi:serine/threonine protein kinase